MQRVLSDVYRTGAALLLSILALSPSVSAEQVTRESWLASMQTILPSYTCQVGQYFRECFEVTAQECEEVMAQSTALCLDEAAGQIPELLNQPRDGTFWGSRVGACAGNDYEVKLMASRISNARCNNPANWSGG